MDRHEFLTQYWRYYLYLEEDFIQLTRYVDLYPENFQIFSDEIHKQLISVGVEFENIFKKICVLLNIALLDKPNINDFKRWIPKEEINIKVIYSLNQFNLSPFKIEKGKILWNCWNQYNSIKHNRIMNLKK